MSRNIKLLLFAVLFANFQIFKFSNCHAQVPQKFNYQGIARDAKGNPLSQQRMTLKLTVLPTSDATEGEYEEIQTVTTNEFGLYTLQIGNGSPLKGEMSAVKWETGNKYIKVAIDPKGGSDFVDAGTNQLLSVPYAIYADKAGVAKNSGSTSRATNNFIEKTNGSGVVNSTSQIYDNGTNIGIGTTSPVARVHVNTATAGVQEHIRMQNTSTTGAGRFTLYNSNASAFATFTKYGTNYAGGYTGISSLYPYANLLAFGNNDTNGAGNGNFLISTEGNTGISIFKGGTSKLKYHVDYATERVGIGGNAVPAARVHANNTDGTSMELMLSNNTTGHTATDGFMIQQSGSDVNLNNKENGNVRLWSNNLERARITATGDVGIGTTAPTAKLDVNGQIRMQGGSPGAGKIMTSNATGVGSWSTAAAAGLVSGSGTTNYVPKYTPDGNTIGNSLLKDSAGLMYNINQQNTSINGLNYATDFSIRGDKNAFVLNKNAAVENQFIMTNSSANIILMGDSTKLQNGGLYDSATFFGNSTTANTSYMGGYSGGLSIRNSDGKMSNSYFGGPLASTAHFTMNSSYDTAGYFSSTSSNLLNNGILRSEYTGSSIVDQVAIYGRSVPSVTSNYGIGVTGEGGWYGVQGFSYINSGNTCYGTTGNATNNGNATGIYGSANYYANTNVGNKYGVQGIATYGLNNYGVYGIASAYSGTNGKAWGGYFSGKQTGVYGSADSASFGQTYLGSFYKEAVGVFGTATMANGFSNQANIGVAGVSTATPGYFNIGMLGQASGATYNYAIVGSAPTGVGNYAGYFEGNVDIAGNLSKSGGTFKIDHPLDPENKYLIHSFVESPDMMNVYNGNITTDANGFATVDLPSYFEAENKDFKYQLTVIGTFAQAIIKEKVNANKFVIQTNQPNVEVSWQVTGVRKDVWANANRVIPEMEKSAQDKGNYIHPELYGASSDRKLGLKGDLTKYNTINELKKEEEAQRQQREADNDLHKQKQEEYRKNWKPQQLPKQQGNPTGANLGMTR
jgi:hypothetical protein